MNLIQGHTFIVKNPKLNFKLGEMYRIYHIYKTNDKVKYAFLNKNNEVLEEEFESIEYAEKLISKMMGK